MRLTSSCPVIHPKPRAGLPGVDFSLKRLMGVERSKSHYSRAQAFGLSSFL